MEEGEKVGVIDLRIDLVRRGGGEHPVVGAAAVDHSPFGDGKDPLLGLHNLGEGRLGPVPGHVVELFPHLAVKAGIGQAEEDEPRRRPPGKRGRRGPHGPP